MNAVVLQFRRDYDTLVALYQSGQSSLASLKRHLLALGYSEALAIAECDEQRWLRDFNSRSKVAL